MVTIPLYVRQQKRHTGWAEAAKCKLPAGGVRASHMGLGAHLPEIQRVNE